VLAGLGEHPAADQPFKPNRSLAVGWLADAPSGLFRSAFRPLKD
jgi:hypothetical protein